MLGDRGGGGGRSNASCSAENKTCRRSSAARTLEAAATADDQRFLLVFYRALRIFFVSPVYRRPRSASDSTAASPLAAVAPRLAQSGPRRRIYLLQGPPSSPPLPTEFSFTSFLHFGIIQNKNKSKDFLVKPQTCPTSRRRRW